MDYEKMIERLRKYKSQRDRLKKELMRAKKENRELIDYLKKLRMVSDVYCPKCGDAMELEVINSEPAIGCFGCDEYWPIKEILSDAKMDGKDGTLSNISREDQKLIDEFIELAKERDEGESSMDLSEGCEYCRNNNNCNAKIQSVFDYGDAEEQKRIHGWIWRNRMMITADIKGSSCTVGPKIMFCPICGKRLKNNLDK